MPQYNTNTRFKQIKASTLLPPQQSTGGSSVLAAVFVTHRYDSSIFFHSHRNQIQSSTQALHGAWYAVINHMEKKPFSPAMPALRLSGGEREWFLTLLSHFAAVRTQRGRGGCSSRAACRGSWAQPCWAVSAFPASTKPLHLKAEKYSRGTIKSLKCIGNSNEENPQKGERMCSCLDQCGCFISCPETNPSLRTFWNTLNSCSFGIQLWGAGWNQLFPTGFLSLGIFWSEILGLKKRICGSLRGH